MPFKFGISLKKLTPNAVKCCVTQFSACCDWATKSDLADENPFAGMAADLKLPKVQATEDDINPFSNPERELIHQSF